MTFGEYVRTFRRVILALALVLGAATAPQMALAEPAPANAATANAPATTANAPAAKANAPAAMPSGPRWVIAPGGYTPMTPTPGKGMPVDGGLSFQTQYSPTGTQALSMHNNILLPIVFVVSGFVLFLLIFVALRFNRRVNPVAAKFSHNTLLEVAWTAIPALILVVMSVYSLDLLAKQFKAAPEHALTVKATGNQWYWTYTYPDNGGFEVTSNMLSEDKAKANGEPPQLAADLRMVVPVGEPIRLQTTGADVIHSFAVPSLWFKLDAVPGRINEKVLIVNTPGVYYGQCSELCGARHGYMPIVVEALDRAHFNAWVMTHKGASLDGLPAAPAPAAPAPAVPAAAAGASGV